MNKYRYIAFNSSLEKTKGEITAASEEEASAILASRNLTAASLKRTKERKLKDRELLYFTSSLEALTAGGLSLKEALETEAGSGSFAASVLLDSIEKGRTFLEAVSGSGLFPPFYETIVSLADRTGSAGRIFLQLKNYLETRKKIRSGIISSLIYPSLVLAVSLALCLIISIFIFPKMKSIFADFSGTGTKTVEENIKSIQYFLYSFSLGTAGAAALFSILKIISGKNTEVKEKMDSFLLRIPVAGKILKVFECMNFSFAMEILTENSMDLKSSLKTASRTASLEPFRKAFSAIRKNISEGKNLEQEFKAQKILPREFSRWIRIGENSGNASSAFTNLRKYFQNEFERKLSSVMNFIEPGIICLTGLFILLIVMKIVVPLFSLYGTGLQ